MKTHQNRISAIHSNNGDPVVPARNTGHRVTALVVVLAVALLAAAHWVKSGQSDSQSNVSARPVEDSNASTEFIYFPAQYVNQATEPTEHIQAF